MGSDEDHGDLSCVPVARQAQKVIVDCLEADLILQAEDKNHGVDPGGELRTEQEINEPSHRQHLQLHLAATEVALHLQKSIFLFLTGGT